MITLFDYLPSQNCFKIRLLLNHLGMHYHTEYVSIFEGEGRTPEYRRINPTGSVPGVRLEDGRTLAESNAILFYLAEGSPYIPLDVYGRAKINQWLSFEQNYIESTLGSLRYWTMTSKLARRPKALVDSKRSSAIKALHILEEAVRGSPFLYGNAYTIADMSVYAYASRAEEAEISLSPFPCFRAWIARVESQPGFLGRVYPYSIDPHSSNELS